MAEKLISNGGLAGAAAVAFFIARVLRKFVQAAAYHHGEGENQQNKVYYTRIGITNGEKYEILHFLKVYADLDANKIRLRTII